MYENRTETILGNEETNRRGEEDGGRMCRGWQYTQGTLSMKWLGWDMIFYTEYNKI